MLSNNAYLYWTGIISKKNLKSMIYNISETKVRFEGIGALQVFMKLY